MAPARNDWTHTGVPDYLLDLNQGFDWSGISDLLYQPLPFLPTSYSRPPSLSIPDAGNVQSSLLSPTFQEQPPPAFQLVQLPRASQPASLSFSPLPTLQRPLFAPTQPLDASATDYWLPSIPASDPYAPRPPEPVQLRSVFQPQRPWQLPQVQTQEPFYGPQQSSALAQFDFSGVPGLRTERPTLELDRFDLSGVPGLRETGRIGPGGIPIPPPTSQLPVPPRAPQIAIPTPIEPPQVQRVGGRVIVPDLTMEPAEVERERFRQNVPAPFGAGLPTSLPGITPGAVPRPGRRQLSDLPVSNIPTPAPAMPTPEEPLTAWRKAETIGAPPEQGEMGLVDLVRGFMTTKDGQTQLSQSGLRRLPVVGVSAQAVDAYDVIRAARRVRDGESTNADVRILEEFEARDNEAQRRGTSIAYDIANVATAIPAFAIEFALTGGAYQGVRKLLGEALAKVAKGAATKAVGRAAGYTAAAAAQTAAMPHRLLASTAQRQLPTEQEIVDGLKDWDDDFLPAVARAVPDVFVEVFSERTGGLVEGPLAAASARLARLPLAQKVAALKAGVTAGWLRLHPDKGIADLWETVRSQTAWNGPIGELFEERVGEAMRAVQPYLREDGEPQPPMIRLLTGEPGPDGPVSDPRWQAARDLAYQVLVEGAAFMVPGVAGGVAGRVPGAARELAETTKKKAGAVAENFTAWLRETDPSLAAVWGRERERTAEPPSMPRPLVAPEPLVAPVGQQAVADPLVGFDLTSVPGMVKKPIAPLGPIARDVSVATPLMAAPEAVTPEAAPSRPILPDGRWEPQEGEQVYQTVRGFGGTPAYIHGEVYKANNGKLRVRVTDTQALVGGGASGKTYQLDQNWTVRGDPEVQRRQAVRQEREAAEKAKREAEQAAATQAMSTSISDAVSNQGHTALTATVPVGARVKEHATGGMGRVVEVDERWGPIIVWDGETTPRTVGKADAEGVYGGYTVAPAGPTSESSAIESQGFDLGGISNLLTAPELGTVAPALGALPTDAAGYTQIDAKQIKVDPKTYQYKGGTDAEGLTDRLRAVGEWDKAAGKASPVIIHELQNGDLYVVDGHQRVGLAKRLQAEGKSVPPLNAIVLRESEGVTPAVARRVGAMLNLQQGTGMGVDVAKVLRAAPLTDYERATIPKDQVSGLKLRTGEDLARLSDTAFLRVVNGQVDPDPGRNESFGAIVGRLVDDPASQLTILRDMAEAELDTQYEAEQFVRSVLSDGLERATQTDMFGTTEVAESLAGPIAKVMASVRRSLRSEKSALGNAVRNEARLVERGNVLNTGANVEGLNAATALDTLLEKYGHTIGPVRTALKQAAGEYHHGNIALPAAAARVIEALERERSVGEVTAGAAIPTERQAFASSAGVNLPSEEGQVEPYAPTRAEPEAVGQQGMFGEAAPPAAPRMDLDAWEDEHIRAEERTGTETTPEISEAVESEMDDFAADLDEIRREDEPSFLRALDVSGLKPVGSNVPEALMLQALEYRRVLADTYQNMPAVNLGERPVPFFDAGGRLTDIEREQVASDPFFQRVSSTLVDMQVAVLERIYGPNKAAAIERIGVLLEDRTYGLFLPNPGTKRTRATIFLNPFEHGVSASPQQAAERAYYTAVHEAVHLTVPMDGPEMDIAVATALARLGSSFANGQISRIVEAYADPADETRFDGANGRLLAVYSASRRRPASKEDSLSVARRRSARPPAKPGAAGEPVADVRQGRGGPSDLLDLKAVDVLDTGELQPRLPGAEDVREREVRTPTFDVPFSLTPTSAKVKATPQSGLFDLLGDRAEERITDYERRPGTDREKSDGLAIGAISDIARAAESAVSARSKPSRTTHLQSKPSLRALGFTPELIREQRLDIRGQVLDRGAHSLASLAQVVRDPRIETFRIIYTKGDVVVATEALTSRLPDSAAAFVSTPSERRYVREQAARYGPNEAKWPETVRERVENIRKSSMARAVFGQGRRMERLGADGYYLLHNHPSGRSSPSFMDGLLTKRMAKALPGLKGHVVINSGEYSVIGPDVDAVPPQTETHKLDMEADRLLTPALPHDVIGQPAAGARDVVAVGQQIHQPGGVTIVFISTNKAHRLIVRAVETVPTSMLRNKEFGKFITNRKSDYGAFHAILYVDHTDSKDAIPFYDAGAVEDVVSGETQRYMSIAQLVGPKPGRVAESPLVFGNRVGEDAPLRYQRKVVSLAEIERIARKKGTTVDEQRKRAIAAGYEIVSAETVTAERAAVAQPSAPKPVSAAAPVASSGASAVPAPVVDPQHVAMGEQVVGFGKHANDKLKDILRLDPAWVQWVVESGNSGRARQVAGWFERDPEFQARRGSHLVSADTAITPEVKEILARHKIVASARGDGRIQLEGKTYDQRERIKAIPGWSFNAGRWSIPPGQLEHFANQLRDIGAVGGRHGIRQAPYASDPRLGGLRAAAEGRPDASQFTNPVESYIGLDTANVLMQGRRLGIPETVITEQVEDAARINRAYQDGLPMFILASEPGSGKTFVLGAAIRELRRSGAKNIVYVTLRSELITQIRKDLTAFGIGDVHFMTYTELRKSKPKPTDVLIFDEAHSIKNVDAGGASQQGKMGAEWIGKAKFTVFASATPYENPVQFQYLAPTGILDNVFGGNFRDFAMAFGASTIEVRSKWGGVFEKPVWMRTQTSDLDAAAARDWLKREGVYTSRRIRLPAEQVDARLVKVMADQSIVNTYEAFVAAVDKNKSALAGFAAAWVKNFEKRILESSKVQQGIIEAQAALDRGRFPIVFVETKAERVINIPDLIEKEYQWGLAAAQAHAMHEKPPPRTDYGLPPVGIVDVLQTFMQDIGIDVITIPSAEDLIVDHFGPEKVAIFSGSVSPAQAQKNLDAWRRGEKPVLQATIPKGGAGLSLHDVVGNHPTTQVNINLPWTATNVVQVSQRSARYGLKGRAELAWLFAENIPFDRELGVRVGGRMADMGAVIHGERLKGSAEIEDWDFEGELFSQSEQGAAPEAEVEDEGDVADYMAAPTGSRPRQAPQSMERAEPADIPVRPGIWPRGEPKPTPTSEIRGVEVPEIVAIARELTGAAPKIVKRFRNAAKLGEFSGTSGGVRLSAELFQPGNERELAQVIGHEFGHLLDWFPSQTLKRGNLAGRLYSLHSYLKETFTTPGGYDISNNDIKQELLDVTRAWRPWNENEESERYSKYRKSARELYADAVSALFNNPGWLEQTAPTFYREFFAGLDTKLDAKLAYFELQAQLNGTREDLIRASRDRVIAGFRRGEAKALDLQRKALAERAEERRNFVKYLQRGFWTKHQPTIKLIDEAIKRGVVIPEDHDPRFMLREYNYIGGPQRAFLERHIVPLHERIIEAGLPEFVVGEWLMYDRIANGDREGLANPNAVSPERAREHMEQIRADLGPDQMGILLNEIVAPLRKVAADRLDALYGEGLMTEEKYNELRQNEAYAPFRIVNYMDREVSWRILPQKGTYDDAADPFTAFALKLLSGIRAQARQHVTYNTIKIIRRANPGEVVPAETKWNGRYQEPVPPQKLGLKGLGLVTYYEKGHLKGVYVSKPIADSLNNESIGRNGELMTVLNMVTMAPVFRPIFTTFNVGWSLVKNPIRDFRRFWSHTPGMSMANALRLYHRNVMAARIRAFGVPKAYGKGNAELDAKVEWAKEMLMQAEESSVLSATYNDLYGHQADEIGETELETRFAKHRIQGYGIERVYPAGQQQLMELLRFMEALGNFWETMPKVAAIDYYGKGRGAKYLTPFQRDFIRRMVGTPDLLDGGTWTPASNKIAIYSNAGIQGTTADWHMLMHPEDVPLGPDGQVMKSGVRWKIIAGTLLPKLVMRLILLGVFGEGARRVLQGGSTKYDRRNNIVIPLAEDSKGNGVVARIPESEFSRLIGGLFDIALDVALPVGNRDVAWAMEQFIDYSGGQLPSLSPGPLKIASDVGQKVTGKRVYDWFRGRQVLSERDVEMGQAAWRPWKKFLSWEFQQLGGGAVWKFYPGDSPEEKTTAQKILEYPISSALLGNTIRITRYGELERISDEDRPIRQKQAFESQRRNDMVNEAVRRYQTLPADQQALGTLRQAAREIATAVYGADDEALDQRTSGVLRSLRLRVAGATADDPVIEWLSSGSANNEQKEAALLSAGKRMTGPQFEALLDEALKMGVISPAVSRRVRQAIRMR